MATFQASLHRVAVDRAGLKSTKPKKKQSEERLWDWLKQKEYEDWVAEGGARKIYDYVVRNWKPMKK